MVDYESLWLLTHDTVLLDTFGPISLLHGIKWKICNKVDAAKEVGCVLLANTPFCKSACKGLCIQAFSVVM